MSVYAVATAATLELSASIAIMQPSISFDRKESPTSASPVLAPIADTSTVAKSPDRLSVITTACTYTRVELLTACVELLDEQTTVRVDWTW
jgi:hypothetical protein